MLDFVLVDLVPVDGQAHADVEDDEGEEREEEEEEEGSLKEEFRCFQRCTKGWLLSYVVVKWVAEISRFLVFGQIVLWNLQ